MMNCKIAALGLLAIALGLAGCGSDGGSSADSAAPSDVGNTASTAAACSAQVSACGTARESTLAIGKAAPALAGATLDGSGDVSLDSLIGKPTVVVFWSPPCPHCQEQMPKIDAIADQSSTKANFMSAAVERPDIPGSPGYRTAAEAATTMKPRCQASP